MHDEADNLIESIARELRRPIHVSAMLDQRVMRGVRTGPAYGRLGLWSRLTTPATVTVTPLRWALLAASLVLFAGFGLVHAVRAVSGTPVVQPIANALGVDKKPASKRVQFVIVAKDARKVAVVGDFNGWDATHTAYQAHDRGGGVWAVTAQVPVGHHRYSFVVDDSLWMADPTAPRVVDNDFGLPNSALVVGGNQ